MPLFQELKPKLLNSGLLRAPQREAYEKLQKFDSNEVDEGEVGIMLPTGWGKSGLVVIRRLR